MGLLSWIIFGAITGWVASIISGRNAKVEALRSIVVGIIGGVVGGVLASSLFGIPNAVNGVNLTSMVVSILVALVSLNLLGLLGKQSSENPRKSARETQSSGSESLQPKIETRVPSTSAASKPAPPRIQPQKDKGSVPISSTDKTESGVIFISYRRSDTAHVAGRVYDRLVGDFGKVSVFKDVDSIPLGMDFKEYLDEKVGECNVLLAIIGDKWLEERNSTGKRRLDDPTDFVRIELESALARKIPVIPLLVGGAPMPSEEELPASLRKLVYRNGIPIRPDPDFHRDMDRLISALKSYV